MFGKSFPLHHVSRSKTTSLAYYFHSNITNVNATYSHQRPPSVGMPRHALRRRMPNSATGRPQFPLGGWECFFPTNSMPTGGGAPGGCYPKYIPTQSVRSEYDLENHPVTFSETLHTGLESNPKNYFLLAFFRIFSKSWSKMQQKLPMDIKNATFRL